MHKVRFLTRDEFRKYDDQRLDLAHKRGVDAAWLHRNQASYGWASLAEVAGPCVAWECPWYYDPLDPDHTERFGKEGFLSKFYWRDWAALRVPISVLCPNGKEWCIDQKSSNGDGWEVKFNGGWEGGLFIVTPSIVVPGYHGFLGSNGAQPGYFSDPI